MKWRFVDLDEVDPISAPAAFEAVMDSVRCGLADDTILFWRPASPAVYVGYHQPVKEDIDVERCRQKGVPIIRRTLGGGTGYCDANQIIYNIIYKEGRSGMPHGPRNVYGLVLQGVIEAVRLLGIVDACIDEQRFGVYANGKKISGSGQLTSGGVVNASGSFLVDFDFSAMKQLLKDPVKNLRAGVREPEEGMTCLRREVGEISVENAKKALRQGFESVLSRAYDGSLSGYEKQLASHLREKYVSDGWNFRADLREDRRKKVLY